MQELQLDPSRLDRYSINLPGLHADFSKHRVNDEVFSSLVNLAAESGVLERARKMMNGEAINKSENRAAMHMAMRHSPKDLTGDICDQVKSSLAELRVTSDAIRSGEWRGCTGKVITDVINIGIGGSDLGPRMVCSALREFSDGPRCHFIANVDGAEINTLLQSLDAETTLITISSKTLTTAETLRNAETALDWFRESLGIETPQTSPHCMAITASKANAMAYGIPEKQILTFPETVGGRYSVWSAIGLPVCIATGFENFEQLLAGAASMDQHFLESPLEKNLPVILGMMGIWCHNFLGLPTQAIVPYCERLRLFVDHLQQLDMESNGKSATLKGEFASAETGPVIWGQTGTNGQHAFFQLLHQGTQQVPVDFIGLVNDKLSSPAHHRMLMANMIAQSKALMLGSANDDPNKHYPGNRPSTTILLDELTPFTLGSLLALYEHKIFTQAAVWDINPFDQWGVELGKKLANELQSGGGQHDVSTLNLMKRTGLAEQ